ncbi:class I SAM-dependent methyltransferase [Marine Group I thaumarchaeote]|uniref:Class I SAM-dependent methyltransferase n=1 Tax=Marine Group I thaumarchaeote TaxID=2511932 RepID=A0A7K4NKH1_9ARCH|nr:class I SAM-dependent methyltransferase [Marine Group I thaumarchaeote]
MNNWPFSDLVSYVMRFSKPGKSKIRVLELGCGSGANIPFFLSLNAEYFGIDGSKTTIRKLKKKNPMLKNNIVVGDFTKELPFQKKFDLIVDRASINHNPTNGIKKCLDLVHQKLKTNGKFIGIDWVSTRDIGYKSGRKTNDIFTKSYVGGRYYGVSKIHFNNEKHLLNLLKNFKILCLDEKIYKSIIPIKNKTIAAWNIVAQKS